MINFYQLQKKMSNKPCGLSKKVSWLLLCSIKWEKVGQNLSFTGKFAFFPKKLCFQLFNNLVGSKELILLQTQKRWKNLEDPYKPSFEVCHTWKNEKKGAIIFSSLGRLPFFFKKLCFQQPLICWRNDLITSIVIVKKPFEHLKTVPGGLSQLIFLRKVSQNLLLQREQLIFEKNLAIDLLGPRDKLLSIAKKGKQTLWSLKKSSLTFVIFDKMRKNRPKSFFHWKVCIFSKILCFQLFNNLVGPEELML